MSSNRLSEASESQRRATAPDLSVWLTANAGSGKTRVLTDRVARLLLEGVNPLHILCLTYTRAAASEMQNRLFRRLGAWTMMADAELARELCALTGGEASTGPGELARARTLFARAIDVPGGLKIQTIHAFAAALLRRFPLEAGVAPDFHELDEASSARLLQQVLDELAREEPEVLRALLAHVSTETQLEQLAEQIVKHRETFSPDGPDRLRRRLGLRRGETLAGLACGAIPSALAARWNEVIAALREGGEQDRENAKTMRDVDPDDPGLEGLHALYTLVFRKDGQPRSRRLTKACRKALGELAEPYEAFLDELIELRNRERALVTLAGTQALHDFAGSLLRRYARAKALRGLLDFDDLISRARRLLHDHALAQWVLFRLDGGLEHILVDEAQDTSPPQWELIRALVREFTAGEGASPDRVRTLFVVGDRKQSIYSFQGADPDAYTRVGEELERDFRAGERAFRRHVLEYSFRSAPAILRVVDATFRGPLADGVEEAVHHEAVLDADAAPGRVDLWPAITAGEKAEERAWHEPPDRPSAESPQARLARAVARAVREMVGQPIRLRGEDSPVTRAIRPGDVLILLRRRSPLFHDIIRACKAEGLPVAGADRMQLGEELAVQDVLALLAGLDLPEDDLAWATALRSPLFGFDEGAIFRLCRAARQAGLPLSAMLRRAARTGEGERAWAEVWEQLAPLRERLDHARPFELISWILADRPGLDGRRRLVARLGPEVEDGLDMLLHQALTYEESEVPSLAGFLSWFHHESVTIKRESERAGGRIRVMSVHGAKGLEAPIVILPDTAVQRRNGSRKDNLLHCEGVPALVPPGRSQVAPVEEAHAARLAAEARESRRLLYVAMTRAERWLIVATAGETGDQPGESWYNMVRAGLEHAGAVPHRFEFGEDLAGEGLRFEEGAWPEAVDAAEQPDTASAPPVPAWAERPPPPAPPIGEPITATALAPAAEGEGGGAPGGLGPEYGTLVHRLLEAGAGSDRERLAQLAERAGRALDSGVRARAVEEAARIIEDPAFAPLFGPSALGEVSIAGCLPGLGPVLGTLDRVLFGEDDVTIVDFKTHRHVPECVEDVPEAILRQLAVYRALVAGAHPDRTVRATVLWTAGPRLMDIPGAVLEAALARSGGAAPDAPVLDPASARS